MIRHASQDDRPDIVELFRACHEASIFTEPFCEESVEIMLDLAEEGEDAACFVTDEADGVLYLALTPAHFNFRITFAAELVFWGKGGRELIAAGAQWAVDKGCSRLRMANEDMIRGAAMDRYYRTCGLEPVGRSYAMELM